MKKIIIAMIFFIVTIIPVLADNNEEYTRLEYQYNNYLIMPESLVYKIQRNDKDYYLYDLRDIKSYIQYHVVGAKSLPWEKIEKGTSLFTLPKNKQVILISSDGFYSLKAIEFFLKRGFKYVYSIEGGMDNWPYKKLLVKQ